jgi:hypothetical protein
MPPAQRDTLIGMETPGSGPADAPVDAPTGAPDVGEPVTDADEPARHAGRVWPFLISPRWILWHVFVVVAFWGMLWLGDWQFHRALAGNGLSWAYTFEWPLFSGFGLVFWVRTVRDEFRLRRGVEGTAIGEAAAVAAAASSLPAGLGVRQVAQPDDDSDDAEVASYNAYLAKLNAEVRQTHGKRRIAR